MNESFMEGLIPILSRESEGDRREVSSCAILGDNLGVSLWGIAWGITFKGKKNRDSESLPSP